MKSLPKKLTIRTTAADCEEGNSVSKGFFSRTFLLFNVLPIREEEGLMVGCIGLVIKGILIFLVFRGYYRPLVAVKE
jgi:hypothetical protein